VLVASGYLQRVRAQQYGSIDSFDHAGARNAAGAAIAGLENYNIAVDVDATNWGAPPMPGKLITVSVTDPQGHVTALVGFRTNHP
jgi:hypothetical protein